MDMQYRERGESAVTLVRVGSGAGRGGIPPHYPPIEIVLVPILAA